MKTKANKSSRSSSQPSAPTLELVPSLLTLKTILVPIDFSATSIKALRYALTFARQFGAQIILLHVVEPVGTPDFAYHPLVMENDKIVKAMHVKLASLRQQEGLPDKLIQKSLVRLGIAFKEITDAARTLKVDLIILTTHGHTGFKHVLLGSTAERVVRHAPCPVLTVREKEHEFA